MQDIATHLWFDKDAPRAAEWYASLIPGSRVTSVTTLRDTPSGDCDVVSFDLAGRAFMAISAGPLFTFNPSISFHLKRRTKGAVDATWAALADGGTVLMPLDRYPFNEWFGWVQDRYRLSWQVMLGGSEDPDPSVIPALMFTGPAAGHAEEALAYYTDVFKSPPPAILSRWGAGNGPDREGTVMFATFTLNGRPFAAMDSAAPHGFTFNEAVSLLVRCDTQEEIDYYWSRLSANPGAEQCGWLKDRFGVSWQVTPSVLGTMLSSSDPARVARVTQAFLKMKKFDIAALERAYTG